MAALAATVPVGLAEAGPAACDNRNNNTISKLTECVSAAGVTEHLAAFQQIATDNGGNRAANTPGYEASVTYVVDTLKAAGWQVKVELFDYFLQGPSELEQLTPVAVEYGSGTFTGTGYGEVTGNVIPVDIVLDPPRDPVTSACDASDFVGLDFSGTNDIAFCGGFGLVAFGIFLRSSAAAGRGSTRRMPNWPRPSLSSTRTGSTRASAFPISPSSMTGLSQSSSGRRSETASTVATTVLRSARGTASPNLPPRTARSCRAPN